MKKDEINEKLNNRFRELIFGDIEVDVVLKDEIMKYYMKKMDSRCDVFFKNTKEITDNLLSDFIAHCIRYDYIYEMEIGKRWKALYSDILRKKIDDYDNKIIVLTNDFEKGKIDNVSVYAEFFAEIKNFFLMNKDFIEENGGKEFYKEKREEIDLDIEYLLGHRIEKNIRHANLR